MDRKTAVEKVEKLQRMVELHMKLTTTAPERFIDTSYGKIRVLEYGFDTKEKRPLFVDIHGGGYVLLSPEYDEQINLRILEKTNIKIISIDYPRAPQNPYPAGVEAVYEVVKHYYDNAEEYGIDKESIGIGGYSSGGNFATVVCIKAGERKDLSIKYQVLCYPSTDPSKDPYEKPKGTQVLTNEDIEMYVLCYLTDPEQARSPYVSPVHASNDQLAGLPPALLIVAGIGDPLSPDGLNYYEKLKAAGVRAELLEFKNALHGFMQSGGPDAEKAIGAMIDFIEAEKDRLG
ncbi:MAG: alpha/beta hydrolase [Methanomassiliicoccaceae archaeon]|nr:alpha/beta hydrolase [Methanomassiliicoccaceae archaeon]